MADDIEISRITLGNGWIVVADYVERTKRVEWTLRSPHNDLLRVSLTALEVQVLMQMRDDERPTVAAGTGPQ
jgi:hypothetical protein